MPSTKKYKILLFLLVLFFQPTVVFAQLSCCSQNGGTYACDYSTSKLYCKDGTVSTECTCRPADTPTPMPGPSPTVAPSPTPPACPAYSAYDAASRVCKCNAGYLANGNVCVAYQDYCWTKYGGNSFYNTDTNECACVGGYTWNANQTSCISFGQLCQNRLGSKSYFDSNRNSCICNEGYFIQNGSCQPFPTQEPPLTQSTSQAIITPTPEPKPTTTLNNLLPTPTNTPPPKVFPTLALKGLGDEYITVKKTNENGLAKILSSIWNFIIHLL